MTRHVALALGLAALALPAFAQDGYDGQGEDGPAWDDTNRPEAPPPDENGARVDVNVDMGASGPGVTFDTFRDGLAPYGEWVSVGSYGYVWRPAHVAAGWRPYYYGRWEWTDEGWLWVSDESWGWATYHYGRWAHDPYYGWIWVPGYQWAPAWVTWRYGPEYVGWAPLAPGFSVYVSSYPVAYSWWSFVPCQRFVGVPVYSVAYSGPYVQNIYRGTRPAPPRAAAYGAVAPAWGGPARPIVERAIGHPIAPVRVQPVGSPAAMAAPARTGVVSIYRPDVRPSPAGWPHAASPSRPWGSPSAGAVAPARPGVAAQPTPRPSGVNWHGGAAQPYAPHPYAPPRQNAPAGAAQPSAPRQYAPPRQNAPVGAAQPSAPRQYAPPRQNAPAPRQYGPAQQHYAPTPRPYAPQGGGTAPRTGGGGARPASPAPQRR